MNFFLDANIPFSSKEIFAPYGKAIHARDVGMQRESDDKIFDYAVGDSAILVTKDLEFGNPNIYPRESSKGLVIIRVPFYFTVQQINHLLKGFLNSIKIEELSSCVTVVEPGKIRMRRS